MKAKLEKEDNRKFKLLCIEATLEEFNERVAFLDELYEDGHEKEALLLCCCYIESLANTLYQQKKGNRWKFVRILREYGREEMLWHIHPKQLRTWIADAKEKWLQQIGSKLTGVLTRAEGKLYTEEQILNFVEPDVDAKELAKIKDNIWGGTLAALAYKGIRNPLVHEMIAQASMSFDRTTFKGKLMPALDFCLFYRALRRIFPTDISSDEGVLPRLREIFMSYFNDSNLTKNRSSQDS